MFCCCVVLKQNNGCDYVCQPFWSWKNRKLDCRLFFRCFLKSPWYELQSSDPTVELSLVSMYRRRIEEQNDWHYISWKLISYWTALIKLRATVDCIDWIRVTFHVIYVDTLSVIKAENMCNIVHRIYTTSIVLIQIYFPKTFAQFIFYIDLITFDHYFGLVNCPHTTKPSS